MNPISYVARSASGIAAITMIGAAVLGAIWGLLLPSYTVDLAGDGVYTPGADFGSADFGYYLAFLLITTILGGIIGVVSFSVLDSWPPVGGQLFAIGLALIASSEFLLVGNLVSRALLDIDALYGPAGTTAMVKTTLDGGGGYFWAPLCAAAVWWVRLWTTLGQAATIAPENSPEPIE
ncbi:MAG: hypothetical protein SPI77_05970 [Corynebacterium sp.]|nr:hypothetical protein [Corynebacterium sp.]